MTEIVNFQRELNPERSRYNHLCNKLTKLSFKANGGGTVVELSTHNPNIEGSNPAAAGPGSIKL